MVRTYRYYGRDVDKVRYEAGTSGQSFKEPPKSMLMGVSAGMGYESIYQNKHEFLIEKSSYYKEIE